MTRICDAFISPYQLSKQSIENLKYFGVTDLVAIPQVQNAETTDQLIANFERILLDVKRLHSWGMRTISSLGIRGAKPKRAGDSMFLRLSELVEKNKLPSVGPVGILEDSQEDWEVFEKQALIAQELNLPLIIAAPDRLEVTASYKMANLLLEMGFPARRCVFRVKDPILVEPLLNDGFSCAVAASIPKRHFSSFLSLDGASTRMQICSNIESNHQDLLMIPKLQDYLLRNEFSNALIGRILYENSADFYQF